MLLLPHSDERCSVSVIATHNVSSWREHALNLAVLAALHLATLRHVVNRALALQLLAVRGVGPGTRLLKLSRVVATNSLSSRAKEAFHTVQISDVLIISLRRSSCVSGILLSLAVVKLLVLAQLARVVSEPAPVLLLVGLLHALHLVLEGVID